MNAVGCDLYNFALTGGVACTLNANTGLGANHAGPSVLIEKSTDGGVKGAVSILQDSRTQDGDGGTSAKQRRR